MGEIAMRLIATTFIAFGLFLTTTVTALAAETPVMLNLTSESGLGDSVGTVMLADTEYGLLLTPDLVGLPPGIHGFHIHVNPDCGPAEKDGASVPGLAAGGHYDPEATGRHEGPYGDGHLGDLPPLYVDDEGRATLPVLAPRLTVNDVVGRSLMVHQNGDNYSDDPQPLGGGGPRLACGVIEGHSYDGKK
jgi:Cu-Zn family superoxide dismutase